MAEIFEKKNEDLKGDIEKIFRALNLKEILAKEKKLILKPNLTTDLPYPITTSPQFVEEVIFNLKKIYKGEILIAEGSGGCDTKMAFERLGFSEISKKFGIKLIDLNREERIKLKNMFGVYLSKEFVMTYDKEKLEKMGIFVAKEIWEKGWNKGELHSLGVHQSIFDLNLYKRANLTLCDARVGIKGNELGGKEFKIGKILASFDAVSLDSYLAKIFGYDWKRIDYLRFCHKKIGEAENFKVIKL